VLALLVGGVLTHRQELADAGRRIGGLSPGWLAVLALTAAAGILADGVFASTVTPALSVRRATMVQQAATAANNTVVGSGPVATGLRVAMLRSWQVPDGAIGLTIVALNLVASYSVWLVALATAVVGLTGAAPEVLDRRVYLAVAAASVVVVASSTALWWALPRPAGPNGSSTRRRAGCAVSPRSTCRASSSGPGSTPADWPGPTVTASC
jgi:hypothetical protein